MARRGSTAALPLLFLLALASRASAARLEGAGARAPAAPAPAPDATETATISFEPGSVAWPGEPITVAVLASGGAAGTLVWRLVTTDPEASEALEPGGAEGVLVFRGGLGDDAPPGGSGSSASATAAPATLSANHTIYIPVRWDRVPSAARYSYGLQLSLVDSAGDATAHVVDQRDQVASYLYGVPRGTCPPGSARRSAALERGSPLAARAPAASPAASPIASVSAWLARSDEGGEGTWTSERAAEREGWAGTSADTARSTGGAAPALPPVAGAPGSPRGDGPRTPPTRATPPPPGLSLVLPSGALAPLTAVAGVRADAPEASADPGVAGAEGALGPPAAALPPTPLAAMASDEDLGALVAWASQNVTLCFVGEKAGLYSLARSRTAPASGGTTAAEPEAVSNASAACALGAAGPGASGVAAWRLDLDVGANTFDLFPSVGDADSGGAVGAASVEPDEGQGEDDAGASSAYALGEEGTGGTDVGGWTSEPELEGGPPALAPTATLGALGATRVACAPASAPRCDARLRRSPDLADAASLPTRAVHVSRLAPQLHGTLASLDVETSNATFRACGPGGPACRAGALPTLSLPASADTVRVVATPVANVSSGVSVEVAGVLLGEDEGASWDGGERSSVSPPSPPPGSSAASPTAYFLGLQPGVLLSVPLTVFAEDGMTSTAYLLQMEREEARAHPVPAGGADDATSAATAAVAAAAAASSAVRPPSDDEHCAPCPLGWVAGGINSTVCSVCPPGSASGAMGASACKACPAGSFAAKWGSARCSRCVAGTFSPGQGTAMCALCPAGTTTASDGASSCTSEDDLVAAAAGTVACSQAYLGSYVVASADGTTILWAGSAAEAASGAASGSSATPSPASPPPPPAAASECSSATSAALVVSFSVVLVGVDPQYASVRAGVDGPLIDIAAAYLRADTASAFNVSTGSVSVDAASVSAESYANGGGYGAGGVSPAPPPPPSAVDAPAEVSAAATRPTARVLSANISATLGVSLPPGATEDQVEAALAVQRLSADRPLEWLSSDPDTFFGRTTSALGASAKAAQATAVEVRPYVAGRDPTRWALLAPGILGMVAGGALVLAGIARTRLWVSWVEGRTGGAAPPSASGGRGPVPPSRPLVSLPRASRAAVWVAVPTRAAAWVSASWRGATSRARVWRGPRFSRWSSGSSDAGDERGIGGV